MKTMLHLSLIKRIAFIAMVFFIYSSCRKEIDQPAKQQEDNSPAFAISNNNNGMQAKAQRIYISNVDQLYAEINNPANVGHTLVLEPGIYFLSSNYPNGGRIELAHDMSLLGQPGHPEAVIIDVSGLPASSYIIPPRTNRTGPIRMGNGYNAIEWITIKNDPANNIRSLIQTDIVAKKNATDPAPPTKVRIAHNIIKGSSIGLSIINSDAVSNGRTVEAEIEDNEIKDNALPPFGSGVQIQNSQVVTGAVIQVTLQRNYIRGNKNGINVINASCDENNITVKSIADTIEENGVGVSLSAGLNVLGPAATGNSILFEADGTAIRNNMGLPEPLQTFIAGGVFMAAGVVGPNLGVPGTVNDNKLEATFKDCQIENNIGSNQINAFGAYSLFSSSLAGSRNKTVIHLIGLTANTAVNAINSLPFEPAGTNTITIYR